MMAQVSATMLAGLAAAVIASGAAQADVAISKKPTENMSCSAGVCSPTAAKAVLNATDLANMLADGDVKVITGSGATDIVVKDSFSWTSTARLTLDAIQSVEFDKPVTVASTGAVTITTNDGGSGGDLLFGDKGNLTFWDTSSSLIINGGSYILASDIDALASDISANQSGSFALANDYALAHRRFRTSPIATLVKGIVEGLGHSVRDLTVADANDKCIGMFATIMGRGAVRNMRLSHANVSSSSPRDFGGVGILAGCNRGLIFNVAVDGTVTSDSMATETSIGGLSGRVFGHIIRSHASADVFANFGYVGGLAGFGMFVSQSYATGNVTVNMDGEAGGALGVCYDCSQVFATGTVTANGNGNVGGLAGVAGDIMVSSYATGDVFGGQHIAGGLVGVSEGPTESSYAVGHVSGPHVGGFAGDNYSGGFDEDYWDLDTSGQEQGCGEGTCDGVTGLSDAQLKSALPAGFSPNIWGQNPNINNGYPYLLANPPPK